MESTTETLKLLNGPLTTELRAINQHFLDCKLNAHWGLDHLTDKFRQASFEEMRDAEAMMHRILLLGGLPNLQRVEAFFTGETAREQFAMAVELETQAIAQLHPAAASCSPTCVDPYEREAAVWHSRHRFPQPPTRLQSGTCSVSEGGLEPPHPFGH